MSLCQPFCLRECERMQVRLDERVHMCVHVRLPVHVCVCMFARVCMCLHERVCLLVRLCVRMFREGKCSACMYNMFWFMIIVLIERRRYT